MFVSLGPGDPELITLKGLKFLQQADIIFCPSTLTPSGKVSSRSKDILLELGLEESRISLFSVPMDKNRSEAIISYKKISTEIEKRYKNGSRIAVAAEGDAGFYSSTHYICDNLSVNNIPTKRIAGVPAFIACGALANIHTVKQEEELYIIPGVITQKDLKERILYGSSIVIMKPSQSEEAIKKVISSMQYVTFHYFENVGIKDKEFYSSDKQNIIERKFPYFSLFIIYK